MAPFQHLSCSHTRYLNTCFVHLLWIAGIEGAQTAIYITGSDRDTLTTVVAKAAAFQASPAPKGEGLVEWFENFAKFILDPILLTSDPAQQLAISEDRSAICHDHCLPLNLSLASCIKFPSGLARVLNRNGCTRKVNISPNAEFPGVNLFLGGIRVRSRQLECERLDTEMIAAAIRRPKRGRPNGPVFPTSE